MHIIIMLEIERFLTDNIEMPKWKHLLAKEWNGMPNIVIIGGGPAGLTAGLYLARGGADALLLEELSVGGQATKTERIDNFPCFPDGIDGYAIGALLEQQATKFGLQTAYESVTALERTPEGFLVTTTERSIDAKAVILCMGATPRKLGLADEARLTGAGVSYCATCDGAFFRGMDVAVVGGGDTALSDAIYLARMCKTVTVVHRRDALRASHALQETALREPKIRFAYNSVPIGIDGAERVEALRLKNVKTGEEATLPVSGVFVAVGVSPRTELVRELVKLDGIGAILTDAHMQTDCAGIYAAGDVRQTPLRQVVTACADGAVAATAALEYISK